MIQNLFKNWDVKKSIITPVLVNLLTAFFLFMFAFLFKDWIYDVFKPRPEVVQYPIYCVAEGYNDTTGQIIADLFIINLDEIKHTEASLIEKIKRSETYKEGMPANPEIIIQWRRERGKILAIIPDKEFNQEKGRVDIRSVDRNGEKWRINIYEILGEAVLKFTILTDYDATIYRKTKASLPFEIDYAGKRH